MRAVLLFVMLLLVPPLSTAEAQEEGTAPPTSPSLAALHIPDAHTAPRDALDPVALSLPFRAGRDRGKGALYGLAIGALVGGVGFAAANYAFTESIPRDEYTLYSFVLGAAAGGAVGAVVGAIIGVPERHEARPQQVRLHLAPELSRRGTVALSVSLPPR